MDNQKIVYGVGGLVIGGIIVFLLMGNLSENSPVSRGMMEKKTETAIKKEETSTHDGMSMTAMNEALKNKTGDEFDKAFIELMTEHHQGAIDMANLIEARAKHQEIKDLGKAIIAAQTKEIQEMNEWAKNWGYISGNKNSVEKDDAMEGGMMGH